MQQNNKMNLIQFIKGSFVGFILLLCIVLISAFFVYKVNLSDKTYIPFVLLSVILSGSVSGYISTLKIRKNGLMNGVVTTIPTALILIIAMFVANNAFSPSMMIPSAVMVLSGAVGGIAAVNIKRKTKKK